MKEMKNRTAEYNRIGQLPIDATFFFLHACVSHPIPTDLVFVGSFLFFSSSFFFFWWSASAVGGYGGTLIRVDGRCSSLWNERFFLDDEENAEQSTGVRWPFSPAGFRPAVQVGTQKQVKKTGFSPPPPPKKKIEAFFFFHVFSDLILFFLFSFFFGVRFFGHFPLHRTITRQFTQDQRLVPSGNDREGKIKQWKKQ